MYHDVSCLVSASASFGCRFKRPLEPSHRKQVKCNEPYVSTVIEVAGAILKYTKYILYIYMYIQCKCKLYMYICNMTMFREMRSAS